MDPVTGHLHALLQHDLDAFNAALLDEAALWRRPPGIPNAAGIWRCTSPETFSTSWEAFCKSLVTAKALLGAGLDTSPVVTFLLHHGKYQTRE